MQRLYVVFSSVVRTCAHNRTVVGNRYMCSRLGVLSACVLLLFKMFMIATFAVSQDALREDFIQSPMRYHSRPLWFWNKPGTTAADLREIMTQCRKQSGYYGFGILPMVEPKTYLTDDYFDLYGAALETAASLGMKMCLYDEYWFPSGSAGGQLATQFPDALGKRLDMVSTNVTGPASISLSMPAGVLMGVVAMRPGGGDRRNITDSVKEGSLTWQAPAGAWTVMLFTCVRDGARGLVDYLDPVSVRRFVQLTHAKYFERFPQHFGTTIDSAFYDEPTFHWIQGGRAWTPAFNEKFIGQHGFDPVIYYPALWHDIGPETAAARNALFGFRAHLYATGFPKVLDDWCRAHKIQLTGHVDQEEIVNPVGLCGDMMKAFAHQSIPGIDQIFQYGRASKAYKIVSSAACNYDRPLVMVECYGAMNGMPVANLYREAMDLFAKGINFMVPHAVWTDTKHVKFQPELSWRDATYGPALADYNRYIGRLQRMLQGGKHVADIALLYPIATLQAGYRFGVGKPYEGGIIPPETDYMDIGERLALQVRRDFTFLHPDVLDAACRVEDETLVLDNTVNREQFTVLILPGCRTIRWSTLKKVREFYERGGTVVATTRLPDSSAELGKDAAVRQTIAAVFGDAPVASDSSYPRVTASSTWEGVGYEPANALDGDGETRWNTAARSGNNQWLAVDFGRRRTVAGTIVRETFARTTAYRIQYWNDTDWVDCVQGEGLGPQKSDTFAPVTTSRVRLCLDTINADCVSISEFEVLDAQNRNLACPRGSFNVKTNACGGRAYFAARPSAAVIQALLDDAGVCYDVTFEEPIAVKGGSLSYIHKHVDGRDIYFIGNSSDTRVDTHVRLRGSLDLETWDPHTGAITPTESTVVGESTRVHLRLPPVHSVFLVGTRGG